MTSTNKDYSLLPSTSTSSPPSRPHTPHISPRRLLLSLLLGTSFVLFLGSLHLSSRSSSSSISLSYWRNRYKENQNNWEKEELKWAKLGAPLDVNAGLKARLKSWEESPMNEPADWVAHNLRTCPSYKIEPNMNGDLIKKAHLLWSSMNTTTILGLRAEMVRHLRKCEKEGKLSESAWGEGRGVVFTAGNADTFTRVLTSLKLLHHHLNSPLPSEIFSFPGEEPEESVRLELEGLGAKLRVVEDAVRDGSRTKNYHIKATAIIASRFREVLYLDSDNLPTGSLAPLDPSTSTFNLTMMEEWSQPSGIWEGKAYKRLGAFFWPDYWKTSADNPIWSIIGVQCRDEWEQEAGQIVIDKKLHLDALLLAEWMMDSSRFKFWFMFSDGDKDMFRFAFLALRKRWAVPGKYVGAGALPTNTMSGFCGHTMLQHDHLGKPMFVHANLLKQIPSGVGVGYAWGRTRSMKNFAPTLGEPVDTPQDEFVDYDVDCDMLANAENDGKAIKEAPPAVRRRAALEKGLRPFFHGGWLSALCIDINWDDPRTDEEINNAKAAVRAATGKPDDEDVDVSFTQSNDGLEIRWRSPLDVAEWEKDPRLRYFEEMFFNEGGHVNGAGF